MCERGYYSEGPMWQAAQAQSATPVPAAAASAQHQGLPDALVNHATAALPAAHTSPTLEVGNHVLPPQERPGPARMLNAEGPPVEAAADRALPAGSHDRRGHNRGGGGGHTVAAGSRVLAVASAQGRVLQQINTIFSQPTYNPCTLCGQGCDTPGPGAKSAQDCSE